MTESMQNTFDQKSKNKELPIVPSLILVLTTLLLISEVSITSTLLTVLVLSIQTSFGLTILRKTSKSGKNFRSTELVIGFLFGTIIFVVFDQLLRTTGYRNSILPLMFVVSLILNWSHRRQLRSVMATFRSDFVALEVHYFAFLVVLIPLCQVWSWTLNLVAVLLGVFVVTPFLKKWVNAAILYVFVFLLTIGVARIRPSFWWLPGWGLDEQEFYARAIFNWGPNGDVLLAGIPLKYQWFGYAWMGAISDVTNARDFEFVTRTSYVVCAVVAVLTVFAISMEIVRDIRKASISTLIIAGASTAISYPVSYSLLSINYLPIAIVLLLGWLLIVIKWVESPTLGSGVAVTVASVVCVSAKSVHIVAIVVIPVVIAAYFLIRGHKTHLFVGAAVPAFCYIYTRIYFPSQKGSGLQNSFAEFTREFGVPPEYSSWASRVSMIVIFFLAITIFPLACLFLANKAMILKPLRWAFLVYFLSASFLGLVYKRVSSTELHFLQIFVLAATVLFVSSLTEILEKHITTRRLRMVALGIFCLVVASFWLPVRPMSNDQLYVEGILRIDAVFATVILASFIISFIYRSYLFRFSVRLKFLTAVLLLVFATSNQIFISLSRDLRPINRVGMTDQLGQTPLREAASWINDHTRTDSVIASNLFSNEGTTDNCDVPESYLVDSIAEQALVSNYYTTVTLVKRRFLAAGVLYASITYDGDIKDRVIASIRPACFPDKLSLRLLQENNVDVYLAYRNQVEASADWSELGEVMFKNNRFVVIEVQNN
jgi:hypothetical protein